MGSHVEARKKARADSSCWCFAVGDVRGEHWLAHSMERHIRHLVKGRLPVVNEPKDYLDNLL